MTDLNDEDLVDLPDDPNLALLAIEKKAREVVIQQLSENGDPHFDDSIRLNYITTVISAAQALNIDDLQDLPIPPVGDDTVRTFHQLTNDVAGFAIRVRVQGARRARKFSVALDQTTKRKLRHLLKQIKEVVDKLEVSESKRERIYDRIAELEEEIDRARTRLEVVASLAISISEAGGKVAKNLEPLWKWVHPLLGLIGKAQEREEVSSVRQFPSAPKQIEAPKNVAGNAQKRDEDRGPVSQKTKPTHVDVDLGSHPKSVTKDGEASS